MSEGELKEKIKKMYDEGKSIRQIASELGMTYSKVRRMLLEQNVKFRGRVAEEVVKEILERGKKVRVQTR
ncbi:helix-turn-helix domain-containing protein [Sulfuracidifex metallicus]|uniref:helix-turn-helix domain-containing protein n=1 Tax=Sulfuracidifex metallicus TaxID=47303 RepID=UPI000B04BF50|nr:helix-turn-helix domain-containing protein [Sulfuracidifex metallicus]